MSDATTLTPVAEDAHASSPVPVHDWQIDSTSQHVTIRLSAEGVSDASIEAGERGFRLAPEQARQIIRDLSAAVLAMDLKRLAGTDDAKDGDAHLREEVDSDLSVETMTRPADTYMRFLQLTEALPGERSSLLPLDPLEERILMRVARTAQDDERLSVRDLMAQSELGSPSTLHGRLKSMRKKGWFRLADTEDSRRKQIELTEAAWRHFDRLSAYVMKALGGGDTAG